MNSFDYDGYYNKEIADFTEAVEQAINASLLASSHDAGLKRYWASVLFTRLCTSSVSILLLCPRSKIDPNGKFWDCSAVSSLTRNLYECVIFFFYIGIENVSDDEWKARLRVMQLHDCMERCRMFEAFDANDPQLPEFQKQADGLRSDLNKNAYFSSLPETETRNTERERSKHFEQG